MEVHKMRSLILTLGAAALLVSGSVMADLELAKKSGCLACHSVDKKIVGPAWADVGKKYKGDASAKAALIAKVKKGGKGNWTAVTGGVPMPPYSPRVSDENIEKLVSFVLSLGN
jgi:cytochrome c